MPANLGVGFEGASSSITTPLPVKPAEAEVFDFYEFVDAIVGPLSTQTRLFHPSERSNLGRDHASVNADHPAFYAFSHPPNAPDIAAIEITGKPKFGIIG